MKITKISLVLAGMFAGCFLSADVKLPLIFSDNMVLQRDAHVPVWGTAAPGEAVTVQFAGQKKSVTAGKDGKWMVKLDPMPANAQNQTMTVTGNNQITRRNILVGEVWLCSGQSNMEWWLKKSLNGKAETAAADYPLMRHFSVPYVTSIEPQDDFYPEKDVRPDYLHEKSGWQICRPDNIGMFSGVAYFFGRELMQKLNVPVGLIDASWGGTRIEGWISPAGFLSVPALKYRSDKVQATVAGSRINRTITADTIIAYDAWLKQAKEDAASGRLISPPPKYPEELNVSVYHQTPAALYNAMIHPLVPMSIRGVLWYQGCGNVIDGMHYNDKMTALLNSFRTAFGNPELPMYFAQLAPFTYGGIDPEALPRFWEAQQTFAMSDPRVGMAVINDVGNIRDIHPTDKQPVGHRLALLAFKGAYGMKNVKALSPELDSFRTDGGKMVLTFRNAEQLATRDGKAPSHFELAGSNGVYYPADAVISGNSITLYSSAVPSPVFARYAWHQTAEPNVRNEAGLQLGAFRTAAPPELALLKSFVPDCGDYELVYRLNPKAPGTSGRKVVYITDNSKKITGKLRRIAYFLYLVKKDGTENYVFVSMDPFTKRPGKTGVPDFESGTVFQGIVKNMEVRSNVAGVKNGRFSEGNIEFWSADYKPANSAKIPGADKNTYDFGDGFSGSGIAKAQYGSMQIHNFRERQTVFAFNNWKAGGRSDLGIGNAPKGNPDWTFAANASGYARAELLVLAETE